MTENKFRSSWKAKGIVFALLLTMTAWLMPVGLWEAQAAEPAQNEADVTAIKAETADSNGADAAKAAARDGQAAKKAHAGVKSTDIVKEVKPGEVKNAAADAKAAALRSPRVDSNGKVTWDCVWFGHYPQSSDGNGGFNNDPIKWRVLSVDGNDAFLLADKNLDAQPYNKEYTGITWENCTLRSWLNSAFLDKAFSSGEQSAVRQTNVVNSDNPEWGTPGGNNTTDKVYLLSIAEAKKPAYGFTSNYDFTKTRQAVNTAYTASRNSYMYGEGETDYWWLRSPGDCRSYAANVHYSGPLSSIGHSVDNSHLAVRPALHLNLSSNLYSYAGTVSSDGGMNEEEGGTPEEPEEPDIPEVPEEPDEPIVPDVPIANPEYKPAEDVNLPSGTQKLQLFEDAGGSAQNAPIFSIFPGNYDIKYPLIDTTISRENNKNGTYTVKMAIGMNKNPVSGSEKAWDSLKQDVEKAKANLSRLGSLETFMNKWGGNRGSFTITEGFTKKPDMNVLGYYEATCDEKGNILSDEGGMLMEAKWQASKTQQCLTAPIPIPYYVELGGGLNATGSGGLKNIINAQSPTLTGKIAINPELLLGAGVGISGVATLGAEGSAGLDYQIVPASKMDITAGCAVKAKLIFVFDETFELVNATFPIWDTTNAAKGLAAGNMAALSSANGESFELTDRSYQNKTTEWNGKLKKKSGLAGTKAVQGNPDISDFELQSYILPDTIPQMKKIGNDTVMVFQSNDAKRNTVNSVKLMYSVYNGSSWSEPKALWDSGTLDAFADMEVINGELYVAWQKCRKKITAGKTDAMIRSIAENSEICWSKYDKAAKQFEPASYITENKMVDMLPAWVKDAPAPTLIWVNNDKNDLTGLEGTKTIQTAKLTGTNWSDPETVGTTKDYISELTGIYHGGENKAAYIAAEKTNLPKLYIAAAGKTEKAEINESQALSGLDAKNGMISYTQGGVLKQYRLSGKTTQEVTAGETAAISPNAVTVTQSGKTSVVWMQNRSDGCTLYSSVKNGSQYSEPVELYRNPAVVGNFFTAELDTGGNWEIVLNAKDRKNSEKTAMIFVRRTSSPKVEVNDAVVNETEMTGKVQPISYSVTNNSEETVSTIELTVSAGDKILLQKNVYCTIAPGETKYLEDKVTLNGIDDTAKLKIQAVARGQKDTSNTDAVQEISMSDFEVSVKKQLQTRSVKFTATITNKGQVTSGGTVVFYGDTAEKHKIKTEEFDPLKPGEKTTVEWIYPNSEILFGNDKTAYCKIKVNTDTTESNLQNNEYYGAIYLWELPVDGKYMANYAITGVKSSYTYTGKAIKPSISIKGLKKGTDYTVTYKNNTKAGTAAVIATGKGEYSGKISKNFVINKAKQTITAKSYTKVYGNKAFSLNAKAKGKLSYKSSNKAVATVSSAGKVTLKGPGKATITITAASTASYKSATKKITVTVKPKKAALSKVTSPKGGTLKAAWKRDAKATGYQVVIASNSKFTKGKKTFTASSSKTVSRTFTKLKKKTTYYVKVRAYKKVGSTKLYGAYSTVKKVKVK